MDVDGLRALGVAWCSEAQFAALLARVAAAEAERDALRASLEPLTPAKLEWAAKCLDYFDAILVQLAPSMNPPDSYEPSSEVQDELRHLAAVLAAPVPSGPAEPTTKETR